VIPKLLRLYPDNPALGSPYDPVGVSKDDRFYGPTNQYKRLASLYADGLFHSGRRLLLDEYVKRNKTPSVYNYLFTANTPGANPALGVYHASELAFGKSRLSEMVGSKLPDVGGIEYHIVYGLYALQNATSPLGKTSAFMMSSWIAFANNLQPNRPSRACFLTYSLYRRYQFSRRLIIRFLFRCYSS
jgi:hypothetical protein